MRKACAQGRAFGFDGKTLIHPGADRSRQPHLRALAQTRSPQARRILDAFAQNPGKGALALDGRMMERLHAEEAARLLALADAIAGSA